MDESPGNHGKELYTGNEGPAGVENAQKPEKSRGEKAFPRAVQTRRTDSDSNQAPDPAARADLRGTCKRSERTVCIYADRTGNPSSVL